MPWGREREAANREKRGVRFFFSVESVTQERRRGCGAVCPRNKRIQRQE